MQGKLINQHLSGYPSDWIIKSTPEERLKDLRRDFLKAQLF